MIRVHDIADDFLADAGAWLPGLPATTEEYLRDAGVVPPGEAGAMADDAQAQATAYSNELRLFGRLGRVFGRRRVYPALAALPIQKNRAGADVVVVVYSFGPGPLKLDDLELGGLRLNGGKRESGTGVKEITATDDPLKGLRYEVREGAAGEPDLTIYPAFGQGASASYADLKKSDGWVSLPLTPPSPKDLTLELQFPSGLAEVKANGTLKQRGVDFRYRYRPVKKDGTYPSEDFKPDGGEGWRFTIQGTTRSVLEVSKTWRNDFLFDSDVAHLPIRVQVKRESGDDHNGTTILSKSVLKGLTSTVAQHPVKKTGVTLVAVEIPLSLLGDNGIPRFSGIATSVLTVWNGSAWSGTAETRNPAAIVRHILLSPENKRALAAGRVDDASLGAFWTDCKGASSDGNLLPDRACDFEFTGQMVIRDMLRLVGSCGRASISKVDGKYGARVDKAWSGDPVQHFTPGNSWGFNGHKIFSRRIHGFRCEFENRAREWNPDLRLVFDDGFSVDGAPAGTVAATEYEPMTFPGITDHDQVLREARYRIAARRLRPEVYELHADWENILCTRGDLVRVNHDVPQWGTMWGTVTSVAGSVVGLSHRVTMDGVSSYAVRFRTSGGVDVLRTVTTGSGEFSSVTCSSAPTGVAVGDLFQFGLNAPGPSVDLLVLAVHPDEDQAARILLVDYNPAVYTAETGAIPSFDPKMTKPPPVLEGAKPPPSTNAPPSSSPGGGGTFGAPGGGNAAQPSPWSGGQTPFVGVSPSAPANGGTSWFSRVWERRG